jgi:hypothetical protein
MVLRTGIDIDRLPPEGTDLLQVMPWPVIGKHTDSNLMSIYEYLRSIPCLEGGPEEDEGPRC